MYANHAESFCPFVELVSVFDPTSDPSVNGCGYVLHLEARRGVLLLDWLARSRLKLRRPGLMEQGEPLKPVISTALELCDQDHGQVTGSSLGSLIMKMVYPENNPHHTSNKASYSRLRQIHCHDEPRQTRSRWLHETRHIRWILTFPQHL